MNVKTTDQYALRIAAASATPRRSDIADSLATPLWHQGRPGRGNAKKTVDKSRKQYRTAPNTDFGW